MDFQHEPSSLELMRERQQLIEQIRLEFAKMVLKNMGRLRQDFERATIKERIQIFMMLLPYVLTKKKNEKQETNKDKLRITAPSSSTELN